jgi:hypothetical protein
MDRRSKSPATLERPFGLPVDKATGCDAGEQPEEQNMANQRSGQGRVKDAEHDGRLKDNGGGQQGQGQAKKGEQDGREGNHGQGRVADPENDGRLKQNR